MLIEEAPDKTSVKERLLEAIQASENNLSLVATDGSYVSVSIGADVEIQMIAGDSNLAAPRLCVTSPLTLDQIMVVFRCFLAKDPRWRDVVDWREGEVEAAIQVANEHSRRMWGKIKKWYVRALLVIPLIALIGTSGDIPKSFAIAWIPVTFGAFIKIIFLCYGKGLPAARKRVGKVLGVSLYYAGATGMYQEYSGWKIDGEASIWKRLTVLAAMIGTAIFLSVIVILSVGLIGGVGSWGFEVMKHFGL
jgi:hypothetical protein